MLYRVARTSAAWFFPTILGLLKKISDFFFPDLFLYKLWYQKAAPYRSAIIWHHNSLIK